MSIKQIAIRGRAAKKPAPPFNPTANKDSNRSRKRRNRNFVSLEVSSRRHRKASRRLAVSQTVSGTRYPAGQVVEYELSSYRSGGKQNYN